MTDAVTEWGQTSAGKKVGKWWITRIEIRIPNLMTAMSLYVLTTPWNSSGRGGRIQNLSNRLVDVCQLRVPVHSHPRKYSPPIPNGRETGWFRKPVATKKLLSPSGYLIHIIRPRKENKNEVQWRSCSLVFGRYPFQTPAGIRAILNEVIVVFRI
jgi:hypothetical protein